MSKYFTKVEVPQGIKGSKKINLANQHITTDSFMNFSVGTFMPVIPKTRFNLASRCFVRMNPLSHPVYGTAQVKKKLFFVPFRVVFPQWNQFIERSVHHFDNSTQLVNRIPVISMIDLVSLFSQNGQYASAITDQTLDAYDFSDDANVKYNMTVKGKKFYQQLVALGYKIDFTMNIKQSSNDYYVSGLKLLCLARIYCDYYYNPMYTDATVYSSVMELFTKNDWGANPVLTSTHLDAIASLLQYTYYQDDYFTTAFDNPVGPVNTNEGNGISITDISLNSSYGTTNRNVINVDGSNTPLIKRGDGSITSIATFTQYIDNALKKLTKYFRRNAFVGGRASARHLAEFGIQLNNDQNNRSVYVDGYDFDLQFSDIMSNADTSSATLGAYAGKGIGQGQNESMTYFNNEFGYYIEVYHISPRVGYYQGISKDTFQIYPLDFYHPDFDNLGMDAVRQAEILIPMRNGKTPQNVVYPTWAPLHERVFGFQPRYLGEYKNKMDTLSGDFLLGSRNAGMEAWHMMRIFNDVGNQNSQGEVSVVHSNNFTRSRHPFQWDRIFASGMGSLGDADNFIINNQYWYEITSPMKGAYDMLEFDPEDHKITMNLEGRHEA